MEVYGVILSCVDNDYQNEILGVFSSKEKAQELKSGTEKYWEDLDISYNDSDLTIIEWSVE